MPYGYSIYFVERGAHRVVKWNPDSGTVEILAGRDDAAAADQKLNGPYGLAFDPGGALLVSDKLNHRICRLGQGRLTPLPMKDVSGHRARRPDSRSSYDPGVLPCPTSLVAEKNGALVAAFYDDNTIYRIHPDGKLDLLLGILRSRPHFWDAPLQSIPPADLGSYPVRGPVGLVERSDGTLFFVERRIDEVREYHPARGVRSIFPLSRFSEWRSRNEAPERGRIQDYHPVSPASLALDAAETLHLCDNLHSCVLRLDLANDTFERVLWNPEGKSFFRDGGPVAVGFGPDGTAWVADSGTRSIRAYSVGADGRWSRTEVVLADIDKVPLRLDSGGMGLVVGP